MPRDNITMQPTYLPLLAMKIIGLLLMLNGLYACSAQDKVEKLSGSTMGTSYHITLMNAPYDINTIDLQQDIDIELAGLVQTFSHYEENSELSRLNQAPLKQWHQVSPELLEVLNTAKNISELSGGAFDVTAGKLLQLWGFGRATGNDEIPDDNAITSALDDIGYIYLEINHNSASVKKNRDIIIDLSAIAKGYAVDRIAELLNKRRIENYMVEIGGEVRARGLNPKHKPWRLGVINPDLLNSDNTASGATPLAAVNIQDSAVATSGDYFNYFEKDGVRYSHTLNPKTGKPITHNLASITVIADTVMYADAWATALNVLGYEAGNRLAESQGIKAYFVWREIDGSLKTAYTSHIKLGDELEQF